jgi:drug/metabolite transporter (DMT)-like permease
MSVSQTSTSASRPLSRSAAYAVLAALVVIWGLNWPIMKLVVHAMPPLWFVVTRLTLGAACLLAFLLVTGRLAKPTRADWPVVISVSVFQYLAVPTWGLAASTLWLGEALPASLVLGGTLILLGVAAIAIGDTRRR